MEEFDLKMASKFCGDCLEIGRELDQPTILWMAKDALEKLGRLSKLRVVFITAELSGAAAALQEVFKIQAFPEGMNSLLLKRSAKLNYVYGSSKTMEEPAQFLFSCEASGLEQIDARILYSVNDFADFEWKKELSEVDYAFLVISGGGRAAERRFVEEWVPEHFDLSRFSIVLSDREGLNHLDGCQDLQAHWERYLKPLSEESQVFVLGTGRLAPYILETLVREKEEQCRLAAWQTVQICFEGALAEVERMQRQIEEHLSDLEACLKGLTDREETMRERGEEIADSIRKELTENIRCHADQTISKYFSQMNASICDTIDQEEDLEEMAKLIPRYMKIVREQLIRELRDRMIREMGKLEERMDTLMRRDAGQFFDKGSNELFTGATPALIFGNLSLALNASMGAAAEHNLSQEKLEARDKEVLKQIVRRLCQAQAEDLRNHIKEMLKISADQAEGKIRGAYDGFAGFVRSEWMRQTEIMRQAYEKRDSIRQAAEQKLLKIKAAMQNVAFHATFF